MTSIKGARWYDGDPLSMHTRRDTYLSEEGSRKLSRKSLKMEFCCHRLYQELVVTCQHLHFHILFPFLDLLAKIKCGMGAFQVAQW